MITPKSLEELATYVEKGNNIFFFTAEWCGDCRFIYPVMPELEAEFPEYQWIHVDRDDYIDLCAQWGIFGIPSFIVIKMEKRLAVSSIKIVKQKKKLRPLSVNYKK